MGRAGPSKFPLKSLGGKRRRAMSAPFLGAMIVLIVLGAFFAIDGGIALAKASTPPCTSNCSPSASTTTYSSTASGPQTSTLLVTSNFFGQTSSSQPYVVINGQTYGPTPFQLSVNYGTYTVTCGAVPGFVTENSPNPGSLVVSNPTSTYSCDYTPASSGSGPVVTLTVSFTECGTLTNGCINSVPGLDIYLFPPGSGTIGSDTYQTQCYSDPSCQMGFTDSSGQVAFVVPQNSGTWTAYLNDGGYGIVTCTMNAGTTANGCSLSVTASSLSIVGAYFPGLTPVYELILGIVIILAGLGFGYAGRKS